MARKSAQTSTSQAKDLDQLIAVLKKDHSRIYDWFVGRGIDFQKFDKTLAKFIASASVLISTALPQAEAAPIEPGELETIHEEVAHKGIKKDSEKAAHVWAQYGQLIRESAAKYDVDPNLIFATIMIESGGNPKAIRHEPRINDASYGLGQLLYGTAKGIGYIGSPQGLYDPAVNIDLIARYHRYNLNRFGHLTAQQLTTAYNTGSPFKTPIRGHLNKFNKWYNRIENIEIDLT